MTALREDVVRYMLACGVDPGQVHVFDAIVCRMNLKPEEVALIVAHFREEPRSEYNDCSPGHIARQKRTEAFMNKVKQRAKEINKQWRNRKRNDIILNGYQQIDKNHRIKGAMVDKRYRTLLRLIVRDYVVDFKKQQNNLKLHERSQFACEVWAFALALERVNKRAASDFLKTIIEQKSDAPGPSPKISKHKSETQHARYSDRVTPRDEKDLAKGRRRCWMRILGMRAAFDDKYVRKMIAAAVCNVQCAWRRKARTASLRRTHERLDAERKCSDEMKLCLREATTVVPKLVEQWRDMQGSLSNLKKQEFVAAGVQCGMITQRQAPGGLGISRRFERVISDVPRMRTLQRRKTGNKSRKRAQSLANLMLASPSKQENDAIKQKLLALLAQMRRHDANVVLNKCLLVNGTYDRELADFLGMPVLDKLAKVRNGNSLVETDTWHWLKQLRQSRTRREKLRFDLGGQWNATRITDSDGKLLAIGRRMTNLQYLAATRRHMKPHLYETDISLRHASRAEKRKHISAKMRNRKLQKETILRQCAIDSVLSKIALRLLGLPSRTVRRRHRCKSFKNCKFYKNCICMFGSASWKWLKGSACIARKKLIYQMAHRGRTHMTGEYHTSKFCPCHGCDGKLYDVGHRFRRCTKPGCQLYENGIDRDISGCISILLKGLYHLLGRKCPPKYLRR